MENLVILQAYLCFLLQHFLILNRAVAEDADRKYDEISRKLMMMEGEFEKAENRLESAKNKQKMLADEAEKLSDSLKVS